LTVESNSPPSGEESWNTADSKRWRVCVVYNPTAGRRRQNRLNAVLGELGRQGAIVELLPTTAPGDAIRFAEECESADWDVLVAAGGDGTLNEVINGWQPEGPPIAVIPLGTANVAAIEIGIPSSPADIARMILEGEERPAFVAAINGRRFLLMSGIGFDAHVVDRISPRLKKLLGKAAYGLEVLRRMVYFRFPDYRVLIDGREEIAASAIIAKGHY